MIHLKKSSRFSYFVSRAQKLDNQIASRACVDPKKKTIALQKKMEKAKRKRIAGS
jgi:hypothetical protein